MLYECWRHLGRPAQSISRAGPPRQNPRRRALLIEALHHRLAEIEKRRDPVTPCAMQGREAAGKRPTRRARIRRHLRHGRCIAPSGGRAFASHTRRTKSASIPSHASPTRRTPRTGAWKIPSSCWHPTPRTRFRAGRAASRRTHDHPARRRHRLHRQRRAADAFRRSHQHREAREHPRVEPGPCPGVAEPVRPCSRKPAPSRVASRKPPTALARLCRGSDFSRRFLCRRPTSRCERGRQESRVWGTALDNSAWWRMVGPDGNWLEVTASATTSAKIHDVATAAFELAWKDGHSLRITARVLRTGATRNSRRTFRSRGSQGRHGQVPRGCPASRRKVATASSPPALVLHRMPTHMRTVCLEFFGSPGRYPGVVEIRDELARPRARARGVQLAGLGTPRQAYLRRSAYTTKSKRGALPRWC